MFSDNTTYELIVNRVRQIRNFGPDRMADEPINRSLGWWPWPSKPDFNDYLMSDYGMNDDDADARFSALQKEYWEEIKAIREVLDELEKEENGRTITDHLNQTGRAIRIWEQIGVPIRRKGDTVFKIWAPRDVMGLPIIKSMYIDWFVIGVTEHTASNYIEIEILKKKLDRWRLGAIILAIILVLAIAYRFDIFI